MWWEDLGIFQSIEGYCRFIEVFLSLFSLLTSSDESN